MSPTATALAAAGFALLVLAGITAVRSLPRRPRVGSLRQWLRTWWLVVPEPREISAVYTVVYGLAAALGVVMIVAPPRAIAHAAATGTIVAVACALLGGAAIAGVGGARDWWALERVGLWLLSSALAGGLVIILALLPASPGERVAAALVVVIAASVLLLRWLLIRCYSYRPRG